MKSTTIEITSTALALLLAGCATNEEVSDNIGVSDITAIISNIDEENGSVDTASYRAFEDGNFVYRMGDPSVRKLRQVNPKATLNDLNDFAIAKCWNGYLKPKIESGEPIHREDALLLDFCMDVQLNMIDTLSVAALGDMTSPGLLHGFVCDMQEKAATATKDIEGIYKDKADIFVRLKANFLMDSTGIRRPMKLWGEQYQCIPPETLATVLNDIKVNNAAARTENGSHPWLWGMAYGLGGLGGGIIGTGIVGTLHSMSPDNLNEVEKSLAAFSQNGVELKNNWQSMRNEVSRYLPEMIRMREMLARARTQMTDAQSRKYVQKVLAESENDKQVVSEYLDYAMYDLPFMVQTYKARADLKGCQGFFNDDEKKMMEVMADYNNAVSGTEMLKRIRTRYAANGYAELVKYFKGELSKAEFNDFVRETRLYNVDQKLDKNGLPDNQLEAIKE